MQLESQGSGLFPHNGHAETLPSSPDQADNYNKKYFLKACTSEQLLLLYHEQPPSPQGAALMNVSSKCWPQGEALMNVSSKC